MGNAEAYIKWLSPPPWAITQARKVIPQLLRSDSCDLIEDIEKLFYSLDGQGRVVSWSRLVGQVGSGFKVYSGF